MLISRRSLLIGQQIYAPNIDCFNSLIYNANFIRGFPYVGGPICLGMGAQATTTTKLFNGARGAFGDHLWQLNYALLTRGGQ